jgi:hypothetical protein
MSQNKVAESLEWNVFPFAENARRSALVVAVILLTGVFVYWAFSEVFLALISILILFASLHTYFTRTTYRLDREGITIRTSLAKTHKKWSDLKRYCTDRRGITLSPFEKPSRLDPFRSVRLLFGSNRDEVVAFVSKILDGDASAGSGR